MRKYTYVTLCDFGTPGRIDVLRRHIAAGTARRAFGALKGIYHGYHGGRVWVAAWCADTEPPSGGRVSAGQLGSTLRDDRGHLLDTNR